MPLPTWPNEIQLLQHGEHVHAAAAWQALHGLGLHGGGRRSAYRLRGGGR